MSVLPRPLTGGALAVLGLALGAACGGGRDSEIPTSRVSPGGSKDPSKWPADDHSLCEWKNRNDVDVSEAAGVGALRPNIRRVYKIVGGEGRKHVLVCREIDTNLDGIKDLVRSFDDKGEPLHEAADTDYNGKLDVWLTFVAGRITQQDVDTNGDGKPDVWKFYANGQLSRIRRDRNHDGKPDVWEIFNDGRLERIGLDDSFDGHVDRWDRDEQLRYEAEAAERKAREAMDGGAAASGPSAAVSDGGAADSGGGDAGSKRR